MILGPCARGSLHLPFLGARPPLCPAAVPGRQIEKIGQRDYLYTDMKKIVVLALCLLSALHAFPETEAQSYREAENHYISGNYLLALELFESFVRAHPLSDRFGDAQYRRGMCLFHLKRYGEAAEVFARMERRHTPARYSDYLPLWLGISAYHLGDYPGALRSLNDFLAGARGERDRDLAAQAFYYRGLSELELGDTGAATSSFSRLVTEYPDFPRRDHGVVLLSFALLKDGAWERILETDAGSLEAPWRARYLLYRAEALWELGRVGEAEALFAGLLAEDADIAAAAYRYLFLSAQLREDLPAMQALVREAEQRFAASPQILKEIWLRVGIESYRQDSPDLAAFFLRKVWDVEDRRRMPPAVPLYLAEIHIAAGEPEQAAELLEEYLGAAEAEQPDALLRLGDIRLQQQDFVAAELLYGRAMELFDDPERRREAGYFRAYARFRAGDLEGARELVTGLRAALPPEAAYARELAALEVTLSRRLDGWQEALALLKDYKSFWPGDLEARENLIKTLFAHKQYRELIVETDLLFRLFPDLKAEEPRLYLLAGYLRGLAQIAEKQYQGASLSLGVIEAAAAEAAGLAVILPYSLYYRGWADYRLGNYARARTALLDLLENYPGHALFPEALFLAGWCSFSLTDYPAAADMFARLAKMGEPLSVKAAFLQGKSLLNQNRLEEAARVFENLLTVDSDFADDALFELADIRAHQGRIREAAESYWNLVHRYPQSPLREEALFKRAETYRQGAEPRLAKEAFFEYRSQFPRGSLVDASLYWSGRAAYELGEPFEAVLYWQKLTDNHPRSPFRADALKRSADAYAERGDYRRALNLLTVMIAEYPEEARAAGAELRAAELRYLLLGLTDEEARLSAIIGREGGARSAEGRRAMIELSRLYIYEGSKRIDLAYEMLLAVIEKQDPETAARAQFLAGEYFYRKSDLARAAEEFLRVPLLDPGDNDLIAAAIFRGAEMMQLAGRPGDARALVERLRQYFPDSQWTEEGAALLERGGTR
jgi:TolA-binding protein